MTRPTAGGPGSNQYQIKPGAPSRRSANADVPAVLSAVTEDPDAEAAAWAFHPDRELWETLGFDRAEAMAHIAAERTPEQAIWVKAPDDGSRWCRNGWTAETAAPWIHRGFTYEQVGPWITGKFDPVEAGRWRDAGFSGRSAAQWNDRQFTRMAAKAWKPAAHSLNIRGTDAVRWAAAWMDAGYTPEQAVKLTTPDRLLP